MPRTWAETQAAFAAALIDPRLSLPADVIECGEPGQRRGFDVHRNNSLVTLMDALHERFPVTCRLVGEEFFRAMARVFVNQHPPRSPLLMHYGDDFPEFIDSFAPAADVPYLSDIARLEALWSEAYHASEATPLSAQSLAGKRPEALLEMQLTLHPSTRVLRSAYPVAAIWSAHQCSATVQSPMHWDAEDVLIARPVADVQVNALGAGQFAFVSALLDPQCVQQAADCALRDNPEFDIGESLLNLFRLGVVVGCGSDGVQERSS